MKNKQLVENILKHVGGTANIATAAHCMTRLRFKLQDESKANTDVLKETDGIVTVIQSGGQYMVVIGQQVADVYDALTSVRCYKSAYDHETALRMIVNGECGTFNPLLLECLLDASLQIRERLREANEGYMHSTARTQQLSTEMMLKQATPQVGRSIQALETERIKTDFFAKQSKSEAKRS